MSGNTETAKTSPLNVIKWVLAVTIAGAAIVGNQYFATHGINLSGVSGSGSEAEPVGLLYRVLAVVALMVVALGIAAMTVQGRAFLVLLKEANIERRKVVWPTRQETTQTTLIVVAVVIVVAILLWGLDSLLSWVVSGVIG